MPDYSGYRPVGNWNENGAGLPILYQASAKPSANRQGSSLCLATLDAGPRAAMRFWDKIPKGPSFS